MIEKEEKFVNIIKVTAKGKKYIVYTDNDEEGILFSENQIVINRIIKGTKFSTEEWEKILDSQNENQLFEQMLHFIDYKLRTKYEVLEKLKKQDVSSCELDSIIEKLEKIGYINDERYAELYIDEAIRNLKGPYLIKYNLEQKRIESNIIQNFLKKFDEKTIKENAKELAIKYQKTVLNLPANKQKELIIQKLTRSGYYMDTINYVINSIEYPEDSIEQLLSEYEKLKLKTDDKHKIITQLLQKGYKYLDIKTIIKKDS